MADQKTIETFVNRFVVDASGAISGAEKVEKSVDKADKSVKSMGKSVSNTGSSIKSISSNFKSLSSAIQIAATSFGLFRVLSNNVAISNISRSTGQAANSIQALQRQFTSMGYSAQDANSAIGDFSQALANARYSGNAEGLRLPSMLGVNIEDENGKLRDTAEILLDIGDAARRLFNGDELAAKQFLSSDTGGLSKAQADFAASTSSRQEYQTQLQLSRLDEPRLARMREINKAWARQRELMSDVSTELLVQLSPALMATAEAASTITTALSENQKAAGLALKAFISLRLLAINPILGALAAAGFVLAEMNEQLKESVNIGGSQGSYIQNLIGTDPESGASVADVLPENPYSASPERSNSGVLQGRYKILSDQVFKAESNVPGSNNGYNAFNKRNRRGTYDAGVADLTSMTLDQIQAAQRSGAMFATGKYQVTTQTLDEAIQGLKLRGDQKFDEATQDQIFKFLADRRGAASRDFLTGKSDNLQAAQREWAKEWAGLEFPGTGRSYYDGIAGNSANITTAQLQEAFRNQPQGFIEQARANSTTSNKNVRIDSITVQTNSTNPRGIADELLKYATSVGEVYEFNSGAAS